MNILIEKDVEIPMRDGVILRADLYRPQDDQKHPALVFRSPYEKETLDRRWGQLSPIGFAKAGYCVVYQDVRGSGTSDGDVNFFMDQGDDGYDTIEWTAAQPWCDGNVGTFGHSYYAYTQLTAAAKRPPHLKCICPFMQGCKPKYSGGFLPNALHADWLLQQADRYLKRITDPEKRAEAQKKLEENTKDMGKQFMYVPEIDMPAMQLYPWFPYMEEYRIKVAGFDDPKIPAMEGRPIDLTQVTTPALMYCGLYDTSSKNGPIENFITLTTENPNPDVRKGTRLVIGPWNHSCIFSNQQGELSFPRAEGDQLQIQAHIIRFLDYWLKGEKTGVEEEAPIRLYIMGKNQWRDEQEWPLARTVYTDFYLHSHGSANTLHGDGALSRKLPEEEEASDSFIYDPEKPVPGRVPGGCAGAIQDFRPIEEREDVLVYSTPVLETGIEVTGPVKAELAISSSAPDTDFFCRLLDVYPDGRSLNITDGIVRARYNNSFDAHLLTPGESRTLTVDMGNTSNYFGPGHQIRLEVTSSCFPMYDRNHNTGNRPGTDKDLAIATNTVHHKPLAASRLILPVIPEEGKNTAKE